MGDVLDDLRRHHDYTFAHSFRVATHLATFALATGMRRDDAELLAQAGLLHDIGKTAIPVGILDKPGPLDSGEWRVVHRHPLIAADVLQRSPALPAHLIRIAERHHERLDGSGYPHGLAGTEIDEPSLLCAIADVHTALTDRRAYRNPVDEAAAFARMRPLAGPHLEPALFRRYEAVMLDSRPADRKRSIADHLDLIAGLQRATAVEAVEQDEQAARIGRRPASGGRRCRPCRRRTGHDLNSPAADARRLGRGEPCRLRRLPSKAATSARSSPPLVGEDEAVDLVVVARDHGEHRRRRLAADRDLAETDRGLALGRAGRAADPAGAGCVTQPCCR